MGKLRICIQNPQRSPPNQNKKATKQAKTRLLYPKKLRKEKTIFLTIQSKANCRKKMVITTLGWVKKRKFGLPEARCLRIGPNTQIGGKKACKPFLEHFCPISAQLGTLRQTVLSPIATPVTRNCPTALSGWAGMSSLKSSFIDGEYWKRLWLDHPGVEGGPWAPASQGRRVRTPTQERIPERCCTRSRPGPGIPRNFA